MISKWKQYSYKLNNSKAYRLPEDLEDLHVITALNKSIQPKQKLSEKYAGKLLADIADELQNYVSQSRNELNNRSLSLQHKQNPLCCPGF